MGLNKLKENLIAVLSSQSLPFRGLCANKSEKGAESEALDSAKNKK
jgi:hypothetical protein